MKEKVIIIFFVGSDELFGIKFLMESDCGFEFVLDNFDLKVGVFVGVGFEVIRVLCINEVEYKS